MTPETLDAMIRMHQNEVFRYLRYLGADYSLAEDLLQEAFVSAYRSKNQPDADNARKQAAWLRVIARNEFYQYCRKAKRQNVHFNTELMEQSEHLWNTEFLRDDDGFDYVNALRQCVETITGKARAVLDDFYVHRKSRREIAAQHDRSEDGIKSMLRKLRLTLADCVEEQLRLDS